MNSHVSCITNTSRIERLNKNTDNNRIYLFKNTSLIKQIIKTLFLWSMIIMLSSFFLFIIYYLTQHRELNNFNSVLNVKIAPSPVSEPILQNKINTDGKNVSYQV